MQATLLAYTDKKQALYLSYLVFELPMNLLLQRLPVAKFL